MQLLLPIFPRETKLLTETLGVFEKDDFIFYLHCGVPIYQHHREDMDGFHYICSRFGRQKLCKQTDIVRTLGVSADSVCRNYTRSISKKVKGHFLDKTTEEEKVID